MAAGALLGLAVALYGGVERPTRVASQATLDEQARLASRGGELEARLAQLASRWAIASGPTATPELAIADLRRDVIKLLAVSDLRGVQLDVREGRAAVAATVVVQARGTTLAALSLIEGLALEGAVVLDSVSLSSLRSDTVQLNVQAFRLGGVP